MWSLCTSPALAFVWCFFKQIAGPDAMPWLAGTGASSQNLNLWSYIFLCSGFLSHNCGRCAGKEKTSKQALDFGLRLSVWLGEAPANIFSQVNSSRRGTHEELCHSPAALHDHKQVTSLPSFPSKISPGWTLFVLLCQCFTHHLSSAERGVLLISIC